MLPGSWGDMRGERGGDEHHGLAVCAADGARARGEVREELDAAERARVHDERAVERRGQEDVDAPMARLDVQIERATRVDLVL